MADIFLTDTMIEVHSKKILLLEQAIEQNVLPDSHLADAWVINHKDQWLVRRFLWSIIRSKDIEIYLKPVFLQKEFKKFYTHKASYLKHLSDGYIENFEILEKFPLIDLTDNFIQKNKDKRNPDDFITENNFLRQKTFDYYYTRNKTIKPVRDSKSLSGYAYPRIEAYFYNKTDSFITSRRLLNEAYKEDCLSRKYVDTSHLCKNCNSGFLNYREICPKCSNHNLQSRFLIHHFRCAYVGIETDFVYKDKLVCPKCSSELRNIGVDYDKPGKVYLCKNKKCGHDFQEPPVGVKCIDCGTEQYPDELIVKKKYKYEITTKGIQRGLESSAGILG